MDVLKTALFPLSQLSALSKSRSLYNMIMVPMILLCLQRTLLQNPDILKPEKHGLAKAIIKACYPLEKNGVKSSKNIWSFQF